MKHPIQSLIPKMRLKNVRQFQNSIKEIEGDGVFEIPVEVLRELIDERGMIKIKICGSVTITLVP
jgi:hypothetical protein